MSLNKRRKRAIAPHLKRMYFEKEGNSLRDAIKMTRQLNPGKYVKVTKREKSVKQGSIAVYLKDNYYSIKDRININFIHRDNLVGVSRNSDIVIVSTEDFRTEIAEI